MIINSRFVLAYCYILSNDNGRNLLRDPPLTPRTAGHIRPRYYQKQSHTSHCTLMRKSIQTCYYLGRQSVRAFCSWPDNGIFPRESRQSDLISQQPTFSFCAFNWMRNWSTCEYRRQVSLTRMTAWQKNVYSSDIRTNKSSLRHYSH